VIKNPKNLSFLFQNWTRAPKLPQTKKKVENLKFFKSSTNEKNEKVELKLNKSPTTEKKVEPKIL